MRHYTIPRSRFPEKLQLRLSALMARRLDQAALAASTLDAPVTPSEIVRLALDRFLPPLVMETTPEPIPPPTCEP